MASQYSYGFPYSNGNPYAYAARPQQAAFAYGYPTAAYASSMGHPLGNAMYGYAQPNIANYPMPNNYYAPQTAPAPTEDNNASYNTTLDPSQAKAEKIKKTAKKFALQTGAVVLGMVGTIALAVGILKLCAPDSFKLFSNLTGKTAQVSNALVETFNQTEGSMWERGIKAFNAGYNTAFPAAAKESKETAADATEKTVIDVVWEQFKQSSPATQESLLNTAQSTMSVSIQDALKEQAAEIAKDKSQWFFVRWAAGIFAKKQTPPTPPLATATQSA